VKQDIFAIVDINTARLYPTSNTGHSNWEIAANLRTGRILGTHWWNPPYLIPLVEVVQASYESSI
jgi:3-hydroxybutyryl-CoA dehydrogenase